MTARFRGRRLPGCVGGQRGRCCLADCSGDLACLAGHPTNSNGSFISFGYGEGNALIVRPSPIPNAGLGLFAAKSFEPNEILTIYDGHVSMKLFVPKNAYESSDPTLSHLHSIPGTEFVLWGFQYPVHARGLGSFCNHSTLPAAKVIRRLLQFPYVGIHTCPELRSHLAVSALRHIYVDEEITIKYPPRTCARLGIVPIVQ